MDGFGGDAKPCIISEAVKMKFMVAYDVSKG